MYDQKNIEKGREKSRKYYQKNKENESEKYRKYYQKNKEKILKRNLKRKMDRYYSDHTYRCTCAIKSLIRKSITTNGYSKDSRTFEVLGCTYEEFKEHIESNWEGWMSWDNYGLYNGEEKYGWDLDHIVPVSSAQCEEDVYKLNHYSNIQPLCSYVNRNVKRDIIDWKS